MTSGASYVEIRSDGADALPVDELTPIADQIVDLIGLLAVGEDAAVWPEGTEEGFAWPDGFGRRTRAQALALLRDQLLRRTYIGKWPVFPRMTLGGWELEVLHPSPPGSSTAYGALLSGPRSRADVEAVLSKAMGARPVTSEGDEVEISAGPVWATAVETPPGLAGRLTLDGADRASRVWAARIGEEVRDVGTRLWCDPPVIESSGAVSIADLYGLLAAVTRSPARRWPRRLWRARRPAAHLYGGTVRIDLAVPGLTPTARQDLLDLAGSPAARHDGCITIQAAEQRQQGRRFGWDHSGKASVVDAWQADVAGAPSQLRLLERTDDSRTRWRWLRISQAPTLAPQ